MSKKHHGGPAPVPPGNRPQRIPAPTTGSDEAATPTTDNGASFQDQDPKRRLGGFGGAGEHPRQQPGALSDGDRHSR
jgi:hypothetical protein